MTLRTVRALTAGGLLCLAASPVAEGDDTPGQSMTLEECVAQALGESVDMRQAELTYERGRLQYEITLAQSSLSLDGSGSLSHSDSLWDSTQENESLLGTNNGQLSLSLGWPTGSASLSATHTLQEPRSPATDSTNSTRVSASARQTIWDGVLGGKTRLTVQQASLSHQNDALTLENRKRDLRFSVAQAYYGLLAQQRTMDLRSETLAQRREEAERTRLLYEAQELSDLDRRQAEINLRSAEIEVAIALNALEASRTRLAILVAADPSSPITAVEAPEPELPALEVESAVQTAMENRSDIRQARTNRQSGEINVALRKASASPQLSANGSADLTRNWTAQSTSSSWSVGIQGSIPIHDAGASRRDVEAAVLQNRITDLQVTALEQSIRTEVVDGMASVREAAMRVELAAMSLEQARLKLELASLQEEAGTGSALETLQASVALSSAEFNSLKARNDLQLAVLSYRRTLGLD